MVSPQYYCLSRISATVATHQLYVTAGRLLHFLPILFQYSVGVSTFSERSCLAIGVGPKPETHISKICLTTFVSGSSTIHSSLLSGFFIYPKGGFGSKRFAQHPLALHYPTHLIAAYCRFAPETQKRPKPAPVVWFRDDSGRFLSGNKKAPYCYDAFVSLGRWSKGTLFNYLLYFFFLLTTVVPMAAPPLTSSRTNHKARLLLSPVFGESVGLAVPFVPVPVLPLFLLH